jgi:hypothetical protein
MIAIQAFLPAPGDAGIVAGFVDARNAVTQRTPQASPHVSKIVAYGEPFAVLKDYKRAVLRPGGTARLREMVDPLLQNALILNHDVQLPTQALLLIFWQTSQG